MALSKLQSLQSTHLQLIKKEKSNCKLHGNITTMPHLPTLVWDYQDNLKEVDLGGGGEVWYVYDASGERVRKVIENRDITEERIYLGGYEIWTKTINGQIADTRETLHVNDGAKRIALLDYENKKTTIR
jgi:YD repeat-containing protein